MEFWPENQGQSSLYSKFGTVPGRNCTHNYHDRHQATHYPLYYGEQQDQSRESSYWTVPGSRTGGAPQEYTNWTDQEMNTHTSSHFPFILDRHPQQQQDLGEYQSHEARDREWTAAQRAAREYERGFLREGWQRRWEPCSPVRYNRDVSTKRSDSSYRELEAWAARYSHSLPRRRRIEAELRGASQGLLESSRAPERDSRSGTDPRVAALQQALQSANIRESGLWDRGGRQQAPTYYPPQTPATDTSHMLDMKEKTGYQRRMFSQPPGYMAPPPYNSPHKTSPVLHHYDTSWEQKGRRQTYWSQPTLRKQDIAADLQDHRKAEKEDFTKPDGNPYTFPELEGLRQESDALQASSPISIQKTHIQPEGTLSLQQPHVLHAVQNKNIKEEASSKVIEGRKFRLNKKTGGLTIFCLVSRIAGTTETPSLPLCTSQTTIQNTELGEVSQGLKDSGETDQTHKLSDEVDFKEPTLTVQSSTSDERNHTATPTCAESKMLEVNLSNKAETDVVASEKANYADSTFGRQVAQSVQPVSVKYPLWREPSFTSRAETESSSSCLKANNEEEESDVLHNQEDSAEVHPVDTEVKRLDINKDTESEDSTDLLVIDTTCVVVKMELIPSPKKEHVHYLDSTPHTEHSPLDIQSTISPECIQSNSQLDQDVTTDQNAETDPLHISERPKTELDSDLMKKQAPAGEHEFLFPCLSSSSVFSERETLEQRAERILGIPLHDCITEQQPEDAASLIESRVDDQEVEPSSIKDNDSDDAVEKIPEDTKEEDQSHNQLEVRQTEDAPSLQEHNDVKDQVGNEGGEDFERPEEQVSNMENDIVSQLETDIKASPEIEMTEDPLLKSTSEDSTTEQSQEENHPVENDTSSQHPSQSLSQPTNLSNASSFSPSPDCEATDPALSLMLSSSDRMSLLHISESNIEEGPDPELIALKSAENLASYPETSSPPHTPSQQLPSPFLPGSADISPSSTPSADHSRSPSPLDLIDQTVENVSGVEDQDEEGETSQLLNAVISDALEDHAKDITEELVSQQQLESGQPDDAACVTESNVTDEQRTEEDDKDLRDHIMEHTLKISQENATEANILQQQLECVQEEDFVCVENYMIETELPIEVSEDPTDHIMEETLKISNENVIEVNNLEQELESCMTEEQLPKEVNEDPTDHIMEQTLKISQEDATEVTIVRQQLECVQPEDVVCAENYMTESELPKDVSEDPTDHIMEETPKISKENAIEVNNLEQQLESCMTKDLQVNVDPTGLLEETISQENVTGSQIQTELNILQPQFNNGQEEDAFCLKETHMAEEEQLQKEADEDPTGLLKQTISKENATDSQTQIEIEVLQDTPQTEPSSLPSPSDCEASKSLSDVLSPSELPSPPHVSHRSDTEFVSVCPSVLNPDVSPAGGIPETVHPPLHLDSCDESLQFSTSSDSPLVLLPSSSTSLPQGGSGSVYSDLPLEEEPQYPKSLWDAVNRIRKHTAPDSENEEEEVSELWDPESAGEDLGYLDAEVDMNSDKIVFGEAEQQEVLTEGSVEDVEVGQIQQNLCHKEPRGHPEEDTLSCSSASSHGSRDTVIVADEDEVEETPPDENDEDLQIAEGEQCCCGEVKHETAAKEEDDGDERVTNESSQSEECLGEGANTTTEVVYTTTEEITDTETDKKENEEVFMASEVADSDKQDD